MYEEVNSDSLSDSDNGGRIFAHQIDMNIPRPNDRIFLFSPTQPGDLNNKLWWDSLVNQYAPTREQS